MVFAYKSMKIIQSSDKLKLMNKYDALSDVLLSLRFRGDLYFRAELRGEFAVELGSERRTIRFHLVRRGSCWLTHPGGRVVELKQGDLVIVPKGVSQVLSSAPDLRALPLEDLLAAGGLNDGVLSFTGEGDRMTSLLCGFCQFDEGINHPLLAQLPDVLLLQPNRLGDQPWELAALRLMELEADLAAQGMGAVLGRALEIVFAQVLRRSAREGVTESNGYMSALADPQLSRALTAIHTIPQENWTLTTLAKEAGLSRARFAERFAATVGQPPIAYLTAWRLIRARDLLRSTALSTEEIAARCGYASLPSFTRRFKKAFGVGPGAWRRTAR